MNPTLKYLNTLKWGMSLRGDKLHFKMRVNSIDETLEKLMKKHPLEVKSYTTKENKIIIGGVIWSKSDLANYLQVIYGD